VQQAFLPKFENEGQDTKIADAIVAGADERWDHPAASAQPVAVQASMPSCRGAVAA
jgi:hypothetical protein